jgi:hypothetical protein
MHSHDHDGEAAFRPKGDRIDGERTEREEPHDLYQAATAGRTDVLGPAGLLRLQRTVGNAGASAMLDEERSPVLDVVGSGGGSPLDSVTRAEMEGRLGHDFGDVRVHTGAAAHESAKSVNAQAYTVGSDIVFQQDAYDPGSAAGQHMLAHELTHVVQQRSGPVDGTDNGGGVRVSDPGDRFEREAAASADQAMSAPTVATPAIPAGSAASVQREAEAEEEEEPAAQTFVQRAGDEYEEEPAE